MKLRLLLTTLFASITILGFSQTSGFSGKTRLDYYTYEKKGEAIITIGSGYVKQKISISITLNGDTLGKWNGTPNNTEIKVPIDLGLSPSNYNANVTVSANNQRNISFSLPIKILQEKLNEVKTDRLTGGLIVNRLPFFPFGFYCYSPVQPTIAEDEVVKGFNMMAPYQKVLPETLNDRIAYLDRCAEVGMKVHYNLLSVSGGGGVGSQIDSLTPERAKELLVNEVKTIMDHPALLAWYISDEPYTARITPDSLIKIYNLIKETDPWHPVSIVFMAPFTSTAKKYANALDIVMADPYPIPDMSPSYTGTVSASLHSEFKGKKSIWMAIQSFGGGELWKREPTAKEVRLMTYSSIINGATGIQYFVRHGQNAFPKSTYMWAECGKMATEIQEITPWLLSDDSSITTKSSSSDVIVLTKKYNNTLMIIAANKANSTRKVDLTTNQNITASTAKVLFENRNVEVKRNTISEYIEPYGTRIYLITTSASNDTIKPNKKNLLIDPGFENLSSPGTPEACYSWTLGDRGATFFTDTRTKVEGLHSLRMTTPKTNQGIRLRFFPINVKPGQLYYISVWAKKSEGHNENQYFELSLGNYGKKRFVLTSEWKEYFVKVRLPYEEDLAKKMNVTLTMSSEGTAWFDMLQIYEGVDIIRSTKPGIPSFIFGTNDQIY